MGASACAHQGHTREFTSPAVQGLTPGSLAGGHLTHLSVHLWGTYSTRPSLLLEGRDSRAEGGREAGREAGRGWAGGEAAAKGELGSVQFLGDQEKPSRVDQSLSNLNMHIVAQGAS